MDEEPSQVPDSGDLIHRRSTVDTSRPFSSVKEAVAIFGERFLIGEALPISKKKIPCSFDVSGPSGLSNSRERLEETKNEVKEKRGEEKKSLGEILSIEIGRRERKEKPVIPLVWEMFSRRKGSSGHRYGSLLGCDWEGVKLF